MYIYWCIKKITIHYLDHLIQKDLHVLECVLLYNNTQFQKILF